MTSDMDGLDAAGRALQRAYREHELDVAQRFWLAWESDPNLSARDFEDAHPFVDPEPDRSVGEAAPAEGRHGR